MATLENKNVYVGNRYVPKIFGEWNNQNSYEGLSIVTYQGASYTSKQAVPIGIDILNEDFWVVTGNYNAQIETYRQQVTQVLNDMDTLETELTEQMNEAVTVLRPTGTDDTLNFTNAVTNSKRVILSEGTYFMNADVTISDVLISGNNVVINPIDQTKYPLIINGNRNTLKGIEIINTNRLGLKVNGNENTIFKNKIHGLERIGDGNISYNPLFYVIGGHNKIIGNDVFNGGAGITVELGVYNLILNNHVHDNAIGIRNAPSAKYTKIILNTVQSNNVSTFSGSDGILLHRNSTGIIVENNVIAKSGEHGIYAQGDSSIIKGNIVFENVSSGIKMGAHETDLYEAVAPYNFKDNTVEGNIVFKNGSDGIYLQTPFENISIIGNHVYDNVSNGIKTVYIDSERFFASGLNVNNNNAQNISIISFEETNIIGNVVKGSISVAGYTANQPDAIQKPLISSNTAKSLTTYRASEPLIIGNVITEFMNITGAANVSKAVVKDNHITVIETGERIDLSMISILDGNIISLINTNFRQTALVLPKKIVNNDITAVGLLNEESLFEYKWMAQNNANTILISDNTFDINDGMFFDMFAGNAVMTNNLFKGGKVSGNVIVFRGLKFIFSSNFHLSTGTFNAIGTDIKGLYTNNAFPTNLTTSTNIIVENNI